MCKNCLKSVILMLMVVGVLAGSVLLRTASAHTTYDSVYNVKNYGAVGNGNADDAGEIANAVTAAMNDGGGTVYFPAGTYKIGSECSDDWFTFFSPVMAEFANGAKLKPIGKMLNFCGGICAGRHQIFDGDRNVWIIENQSELYPEWWGANGHDEVSDYSAFQCMMDNLSNGNDRTYKISLDSSGRYILDGSLVLPAGWTLQGSAGTVGLRDSGNTILSTVGSTIVMYDGGGLYLSDSTTVSGVNILANLSWPQPNADGYTQSQGLVVSAGAGNVTIEKGIIAGFANGIWAVSLVGQCVSQLRMRDLNIDCRDYCIRLHNSYSCNYLENIHCWPFGTVGSSATTRPGTAFDFKSRDDGTNMVNCYAYGYAIGFELDRANMFRIINCMAEYPVGSNDGAVGFSIYGGNWNIELIGCIADGMTYGYDIDVEPHTRLRMVGCQAYNIDNKCVCVGSGRVLLEACDFYNARYGVYRTGGDVLVHGNMFSNMTTASISGTVTSYDNIFP